MQVNFQILASSKWLLLGALCQKIRLSSILSLVLNQIKLRLDSIPELAYHLVHTFVTLSLCMNILYIHFE